ncbi:unnamed protein product [Callosobruchus maculatus]|uniref:Major facilitator superfamily (MFS) profile domain-containing protein n=1 Tax=Callosobruchus maculatus TaxID=64391 RepID=A0A653CAI3_CALMS|nr:unnamed protein product [Callosobruchus maculatus]
MKLACKIASRRRRQYLACASAALCVVSAEMHFGWSSPSIPILASGEYYFTITEDQASWLAVLLLAGTVVGAFFAGAFANILGRKKMVLLTVVPLLVGWLMIASANNLLILDAARFIAGLSNGLCFSTIPMYLGEVSEPDIRGMLSTLGPICIALGILLINVLGNYIALHTTAYIASIFPAILFFTFLWMPESPTYLLQEKKEEAAKKNLVLLRGEEEGKKELDRLVEYMKNEPEENASWCDLFTCKVNRKAMLIAYGLRTTQQLCGTTFIIFYCKTLFVESKEFLSPNAATILYGLLQLLFSFVASFVIDKFGRKPLLIVSLVGASTAMLVLSVFAYFEKNIQVDLSHLTYIPFSCLMINVAFTSIGIATIPLVMVGEMFAAKIRPKAVCVSTIYYSLFGLVVTELYFFVGESYGMYFPFLICTLVGFAIILFVVRVVPETKGKTLEDIQKELAETVVRKKIGRSQIGLENFNGMASPPSDNDRHNSKT